MRLGGGISPLLGPLEGGWVYPYILGPLATGGGPPSLTAQRPSAILWESGGRESPATPYNRTTTMSITVPTSNQIGTTLERIARAIAILIAATIAAVFITRQTLTGLATLARNLTSRPLPTLIDLIPSVTPTPAPTPNLLTMLGAEILTDAEMVAEIARYDARKRPATAKPSARRKPAAATKVAVGA